MTNFAGFLLCFTNVAFNFSFYQTTIFLFPKRHLTKQFLPQQSIQHCQAPRGWACPNHGFKSSFLIREKPHRPSSGSMLLMAPFEACHSPQLNIVCDLSGSTCSSAKAQFPLARTVITSADKNVCFQFKPTQFHLAPALTLLGSRNSAGAAAGEE